MSHILLDGDSRSVDAVRTLLAGWGLTSASLTEWPAGHDGPTIHDCDAVVVALDPESTWTAGISGVSDQPPVSKGESYGVCPAPAAPLLLLSSNPERFLLSRDAWQVVEEPGPGGSDLRFALQACVDRARRLRNEADGPQLQEDYFHFLGHELRSPLTAVKTALEVLQGDLGGLAGDDPSSGGGRPSHPGLKMIDIALRNVRRLHATVDWSQELLEMSRSHIVADKHPVAVDDLTDTLPEVATDAAVPDGTRVLTDPDLLSTLTEQIMRLLDYVGPGVPVQARWTLADDRPHTLVLKMTLRHGVRSVSTRRTGLGGTSGEEADQWQALAGFLVSRPLLEQLGADLRLTHGPDGVPGADLSLPLAEPTVTAKDQPALLHTLA